MIRWVLIWQDTVSQKHFFSLRSRPPQNPLWHIMCIGWLSKIQHCVQVYLKLGCLIPKTPPEWTIHFTQDVKTWLDHFLERMEKFTKLSNVERESNKERSRKEPPIDLRMTHVLIYFSFNLTMQLFFGMKYCQWCNLGTTYDIYNAYYTLML